VKKIFFSVSVFLAVALSVANAYGGGAKKMDGKEFY
jgi:hypothetical protein